MRHSYSRLLCLPLRRLWRRLLLVAVCAAVNTSTALAGVGDIDPTYGNNGIFQLPLSATGDCLLRRSSAPVAQAGLLGDGSIVYSTASGGGTTQYGHTDVNGRPDLAYGFAGNRVLQAGFEMCSANGITGPALRTADGKLWLGGSFIGSAGRQSAILRLDSSGNPDTSFGAGGMVTRPAGSFEVNSKSGDGNWVYRFALQPDGRVLALLAGSSSSITSATDKVVGLRRYNTDGSADADFGTNGGNAVLPVHSLPYFDVLTGGNIYLGWDYGEFELLLDANGVAGSTPIVNASPYWWLVAILPGGDLLYASNDGARSQIARLHADGTPVVSFGGLGTGYTPVVGDSSGTTLSIISVSSAAASSNGRYILVAGSARIGSTASNVVNVVARLDSTTGALDPLFGDRGIVVLGRSLGVTDMVEQPDGSVVLLSGATAIRLQASAAPSLGLISIASTSALETAGTMSVRVSRTAGNAGAVSVSYATGDTSTVFYPCCVPATAGKDYTPVTGQLDWADGDTADKLITIPVMNDAASPFGKVFDVTLGAVMGSPVIAVPKVTATIQNVTTSATASNASPTTQSASGGGGFDVLTLGLMLLCLLLRLAQWRHLLFAAGYASNGAAGARNTSIRCVVASLTTLLLIPGLLRAGVGDIDASYGDGGFVATSGQVGTLGDGSLIYSVGSATAGSIDYAHIDINGHPDTLFGIAGRLTVPADDVGNPARTLRTPGGQLLLSVRKSGNFGLLRLDAAGRLDPSFGTAGIATVGGALAACASETFDGLAVLPDGRVMMLLSTHGPSYLSDVLVSIAVIQLTSHGVVDQRFANGTGVFALATADCRFGGTETIASLSAFQDGTMVVDHPPSRLYLGADGARLASLPVVSGLRTDVTDWRYAGTFPNGDALLSGISAATPAGETVIARLHADGSIDRSFGGAGTGYAQFALARLATSQSDAIVDTQSTFIGIDGRHIYVAVGLERRCRCSSNFDLAVARVLADGSQSGTLDNSFGNSGIVLLAKSSMHQIVDIVEQPAGAAVIRTSNGIALRLLGDSTRSPGAVSIIGDSPVALETEGTMIVRVSRTAGDDGAISVAYATRDAAAVVLPGGSCCVPATAGKDYTAVTGQLDWADGDTADKLITIPVMNDTASLSNKVFDITFSAVIGRPVIAAPKVTATIRNFTTAATAANASAPPASDGGGGSLDGWTLLCLVGLATISASRVRSRGGRPIPQSGWSSSF